MYPTEARGWNADGMPITGTPASRATSPSLPPVVATMRFAPIASAASKQAIVSSVLPE